LSIDIFKKTKKLTFYGEKQNSLGLTKRVLSLIINE